MVARIWVMNVVLVLSVSTGLAMQRGSERACEKAYNHYTFCDTKLQVVRRVRDLVSRLSLDEKVSQLVNSAPPISRLGIPGYEWWSESLHGLSGYGKGLWFNGSIKAATIFPQVILSAASFDPHLWYRIAQGPKGGKLQQHTKAAVQQNKLKEQDIDKALHNLFSVRMRLGLFDGGQSSKPFGKIAARHICSEEHQSLALEAARNSIVLLKNSNKLLPLPKAKTMSLGVIGPSADSIDTLLGNYAGPPCESTTPLKALKRYVRNIQYHSGCDTVDCSSVSINEAVKIAKEVDHVVLVMGLDRNQEAETQDRSDLLLPGKQQFLITTVAQAAKNPVVLVLLCGGPVDTTFAKQDMKVGSILWAGYPGQAGGTALAEIIFGEHNPGGKLPITWYPQDFVKVPMTDMRMRPEPSSGYPGRTYRFYRGQKVFEFGHGLSYSTYSYKFLSVSKPHLYLNHSSSPQMNTGLESSLYTLVSELGTDSCEQTKFSAVIGVKNHGEMAGKHPVLLFARPGELKNMDAMKQLIGFQSIHLDAGKMAEIEFVVNPCEHLQKAGEDGLMVIEEGTYFLIVGEKEHPITITI